MTTMFIPSRGFRAGTRGRSIRTGSGVSMRLLLGGSGLGTTLIGRPLPIRCDPLPVRYWESSVALWKVMDPSIGTREALMLANSSSTTALLKNLLLSSVREHSTRWPYGWLVSMPSRYTAHACLLGRSASWTGVTRCTCTHASTMTSLAIALTSRWSRTCPIVRYDASLGLRRGGRTSRSYRLLRG